MTSPSQWAVEWCRAQHRANWAELTGDPYEDYVSTILRVAHDDFVNPSPAGRLGDRKCDGMAVGGRLFYACYGSRPQPGSTEAAIVNKIESDFSGAIKDWPQIEEWRFVTNARCGPDVAALIAAMQRAHENSADRPIRVRLWSDEANMWNSLLAGMSPQQRDLVFPGRPGLVSPDLADVQPLLEIFNENLVPIDLAGDIPQVPPNKMDFNELSGITRFELNAGRAFAPRIERWYRQQSNADLADLHGSRFREIYLQHSSNHPNQPGEVMEAIYGSLAGDGFRRNSKLASAVYTVVSYFFDRCHIFEVPEEGDDIVVAD